MAILSHCVLALVFATCVTVNAKVHNPYDDAYYHYDASYTNSHYKAPCAFNYAYNPAELASVESKLQSCMASLPSKGFPNTSIPRLDCAIAGVNSLRDAKERSLSGVPAAVLACLRLPRYQKSLNLDESQIAKVTPCINSVSL